MAQDLDHLDDPAAWSPALPDWLTDSAPPPETPDWLVGALPEPPPLGLPEPAAFELPEPPALELPEPPALPAVADVEWEPPLLDLPPPAPAIPEPPLPELAAVAPPAPAPLPEPAPPPPVAESNPIRFLDDKTQEVMSVPRVATRLGVTVHARKPGRSTIYGVIVRNSRNRAIHEVAVEHEIPLGLRFLAADPPARHRGRKLIWNVPSLASGGGQTLRIKVAPAELDAEARDYRAGFDVSSVHETALVLAISGPMRMRLGERSTLKLRVINTSDVTIPETLLQCRLSSTQVGAKVELLESRVGELKPGQSRTIRLETQIRRPGQLQCVATAIARGFQPASARLVIKADFGAALSGRAARALDAAEPAAPEAPTGERRLLFSLASGDYAIPVAHVLHIDRPPDVTPVPHVPGWVLGVANVRGDILSVVDLRGFAGLPAHPQPHRRQMIVARSTTGDVTLGLMVDRVLGIRPLPPGAPERTAAADDRLAAYVQEITNWDGADLPVLNLDRLLSSPALNSFETP